MKKNPTKKAAALSYEANIDDAPKVVAKGKGLLADKIVALAKEHNIPLYEDQDLVEILEAMDLNAEIPPNLYRAIAEVLVFVYRLNQQYSPATQPKDV